MEFRMSWILKIELPCRRELNFYVFPLSDFNRDVWLNLECLGSFFGSTWSFLGASWAPFGPNLGALGANLVAFDPNLGALDANLGPT